MNPILRLGKREALRAKGRTAFITAMIGIPIVLIAFGDVVGRSAQLTDKEKYAFQVGSADARLSYYSSPMVQNASGTDVRSKVLRLPDGAISSPERTPDPVDVHTLLPKDAQIISDDTYSTVVRTQDGLSNMQFREFDYANPVVFPIIKQLSGRSPANKNEVVLSKRAAKAIGAKIGDTVEVTTNGGKKFTVVGTVENPQSLKDSFLIGTPGSFPMSGDDQRYSNTKYYIRSATKLSWTDVEKLNDAGYAVMARSVLENPPPADRIAMNDPVYDRNSTVPVSEYAIITLIGGLVALEICLLAGSAFAVGARRRRRSLALVIATGGTRRHVRNIVLAEALVIGVGAAIVGVILGCGAVFVLRHHLENLASSRFGDIHLRLVDLTLIVGLGIAAAVASALLPARSAARQDAAAALTGQAQQPKSTWRFATAGFALLVIGIGIAVFGATRRALEVVLVGAVLSELALVILTPVIIGIIGRLGPQLPLVGRLALRDAVRNRGRTAPAVAAILAGVAGAVSVSMYAATMNVNDRENYMPNAQPNQALIYVPKTTGDAEAIRKLAVQELGGKESAIVTAVELPCPANSFACGGMTIKRDVSNRCPAFDGNNTGPHVYGRDQRCDVPYYGSLPQFVKGDATTMQVLLGSAPEDARRVLQQGGVVVTNKLDIFDNKATLTISRTDGSTYDEIFPAAYVKPSPNPSGPQMLLSEAAMQKAGLSTADSITVAVNPGHKVSNKEESHLRSSLNSISPTIGLSVERGYVDRYRIAVVVLGVVSVLLALFASAIVTGLALADGEADQATLFAVGAGPHIRRIVSGAQACTVAILGAVLGIIAGFIPGAAFAWVARYRALATGDYIHVSMPWMQIIPWATFGGLVIAVPLVAMGLAALFTRSRITLTRRLG